jgi:hypothetical protein
MARFRGTICIGGGRSAKLLTFLLAFDKNLLRQVQILSSPALAPVLRCDAVQSVTT